MLLDFDRSVADTDPISLESALRRGHALVNRPVLLIMLFVAIAGMVAAFVTWRVVLLAVSLSAPVLGWLWWSIAAPRWRAWALRRGVDADELQEAAESQGLLWPRGHFLERTEFPVRKR